MLEKLTEMTLKINKKMKAAGLEANGRDKSPRRTDESVESKEDTGESRAQKTAGKAQKSN